MIKTMGKNAEMLSSGRLYSTPLPSGLSLGLQDPHFFFFFFFHISILAFCPKRGLFGTDSSISVLLPGVRFLTQALLTNSFLLLSRQKAGMKSKCFGCHWL